MKQASIIAGLYFATLVLQGCSDSKPKPTGMPGDNLDLYAVLDLFKSSTSVENFEKALNDKSKKVNNLDLNGDGKVDYIRVIDKYDGNDHAITLRVPVSKNESQDMAVIEIEKTGDKTASVQIIGDEDMYGKDVIIEPKEKNNEAGFIYASSAIGVNVWFWPVILYVYSPDYVVWESPYDFDYYPDYWVSWPPVEYDVYYPIVFADHGPYIAYEERRFRHADEIYFSNRMHSGFVIERQKNGDFREGKQKPDEGNNFRKESPDHFMRENAHNDNHASGNKKETGFGTPNVREEHHAAPKNYAGNNFRNYGSNSQKSFSPKENNAAPKGYNPAQKEYNQMPKGSDQKSMGSTLPKAVGPTRSGAAPRGGGGKHK
ncbi:MAG TPA: hypothetical protein VFJ43_13760 [Bacteroidia bacterium]|nr:hypothetical protein [Bacteroidia bacterium]